MLNVMVFSGNLGKDAKLSYLDDGTPVANFSVGAGYWQKEAQTQWISCSLWGTRAESMSDMLTKGTKVTIVGDFAGVYAYEDNQGETRVNLNVRVNTIDFPKGKPDVEEEIEEEEEDDNLVPF